MQLDMSTLLGKIQTSLTSKQLPLSGDSEVSYLLQRAPPTRYYNAHIICLGSVLNFLGKMQTGDVGCPPLSPL